MYNKELFQISPYASSQKEKESLLLHELNLLTQHHLDHCEAYKKIFHVLQLQYPPYMTVESIPYLPVGLFKKVDMLSIPRPLVYKTLLSSGTTGSVPSRIYLDRETAQTQTAALAAIITNFIGSHRLPMLIVDREDVIQDPKMFSARGAGILGMLNFGFDPFYLLDNKDQIKWEGLKEWLNRHGQSPLLIFGFTFMIWNHLIEALGSKGICLPQAILVHSGGWKRLQEQEVSAAAFKQALLERVDIRRCHNFYGMVEQVGSVFMECEEGRLHCPVFADVVVRHPLTWLPCLAGEEGVLQVLSMLPQSYPGHSLLTEDLGAWIGVDDCPCGRKGRTLSVHGRVPQAEPRGCSDVGGSYATV